MAFDPLSPVNHAPVVSAELRGQFTGLFDLIQTIPVGPAGPQGVPGDSVNAAVIDGFVTEAPGSMGSATVGLTAGTLHFTFSIPRGDVGAQGTTGADGGIGPTGATGPVGPAFTSFVIDSVTTLGAAQPATVTAVFDGTSVKLAFGIPQGTQGPQGFDGGTGPQGPTGPPFTSFAVDSVTTLTAGNPATVTATFDGSSVRFAFGIPQGPQGNNGNDGGTGPQGVQGAPGEVSLAQLNTAIANTSSNSNTVVQLGTPYGDPDTEALRQKLNELILALRK